MTKEEFYLTAITSILPTCADKLEDFPFRFRAKQLQNETIRAIRRLDKHFMDVGDVEIWEQQGQIQVAFLQWLELQWEQITKEETI
jgi:hypothetical protein